MKTLTLILGIGLGLNALLLVGIWHAESVNGEALTSLHRDLGDLPRLRYEVAVISEEVGGKTAEQAAKDVSQEELAQRLEDGNLKMIDGGIHDRRY